MLRKTSQALNIVKILQSDWGFSCLSLDFENLEICEFIVLFHGQLQGVFERIICKTEFI